MFLDSGASYKSNTGKTNEKKDGENKGDINPSKRTRSELSSIDSEASDAYSIQILEELKDIKEKLNDTVKTSDLRSTVRDIFGELVNDLKVDMENKVTALKTEYETRIVGYKNDVDSLNVDNDRLRGLVMQQKQEISEMKKVVKESHKIAIESKSKANKNEQYSRKTNVKIYGVDDVRGANGKWQDTQTTVRQVLKKKVNVDIKSEDIIACHRIPGGQGDIRPVLLKVKNTDIKSKIMRKRKDFRDDKTGRRLADDVTKDNADLINRLNKHEKIESAWFFNCNVFAKLKDDKTDQRVVFDINDDIDRKIKKRLKGSNLTDANQGYDTDSGSEQED